MPHIPVHWIEPWTFPEARMAAYLDPIAAFRVERSLLEVASQRRPRGIWVNWPTTAFVLGAWRASRRLRLPLYVHLHDIWGEAFRGRKRVVESLAAACFEGRVLRDAARVFTITSEAKDYYKKRCHVDSYVLAHSIPDEDLSVSGEPTERLTGKSAVLHYAGSIYPLMNQDAIVNVVRSLPHCRHRVAFDCFTPNDPASLSKIGIVGPSVQCRFAPKKDVMAAQRGSDILVLALAFESTNPSEIRTVFPTKLLEYFTCGRPILVHAPADSWAARSARMHGWGYVVDQPDPFLLAQAIDTLLDDQQLSQKLVSCARKEACARAASAVARDLWNEVRRIEASWKS